MNISSWFYLYLVIGMIDGFLAVRSLKKLVKNPQDVLEKQAVAEANSLLSLLSIYMDAIGMSENMLYTLAFLLVMILWLPLKIRSAIVRISKRK
jgi:hypothetical protein